MILNLFRTSSDRCEEEFKKEIETDSLKDKMQEVFLLALEREPKIFLGLPAASYHLIKMLSAKAPTPTLNILICLKKIRLDDSYAILAIHFGMSSANISRIFRKTLFILAQLMQELILWPLQERIRFTLANTI